MSGEMAFSSSSSLEPLAVLVAASSGRILLACRLLSNAVSARRRVWAMFSMTLPPVSSDRWGLRAARCFRARLLSAYGWKTGWGIQNTGYEMQSTAYRIRYSGYGMSGLSSAMLRLHPPDIRPQSAANVHKHKTPYHPVLSFLAGLQIANCATDSTGILIPLGSEKSDFNCNLSKSA